MCLNLGSSNSLLYHYFNYCRFILEISITPIFFQQKIHVGEEKMELVVGGFDAKEAKEGIELKLCETIVEVHV